MHTGTVCFKEQLTYSVMSHDVPFRPEISTQQASSKGCVSGPTPRTPLLLRSSTSGEHDFVAVRSQTIAVLLLVQPCSHQLGLTRAVVMTSDGREYMETPCLAQSTVFLRIRHTTVSSTLLGIRQLTRRGRSLFTRKFSVKLSK